MRVVALLCVVLALGGPALAGVIEGRKGPYPKDPPPPPPASAADLHKAEKAALAARKRLEPPRRPRSGWLRPQPR